MHLFVAFSFSLTFFLQFFPAFLLCLVLFQSGKTELRLLRFSLAIVATVAILQVLSRVFDLLGRVKYNTDAGVKFHQGPDHFVGLERNFVVGKVDLRES